MPDLDILFELIRGARKLLVQVVLKQKACALANLSADSKSTPFKFCVSVLTRVGHRQEKPRKSYLHRLVLPSGKDIGQVIVKIRIGPVSFQAGQDLCTRMQLDALIACARNLFSFKACR